MMEQKADRFCNRCENKWYPVIQNDVLMVICQRCKNTKTKDDNDNLVLTNAPITLTDLYGDTFRHTPNDPTAQKIRKLCGKCGAKVKFLLTLGKDQPPLLFCACEIGFDS